MKFGKDVLLEIVSIVQDGLVNGTDVSQRLRELDVVPESDTDIVLTSENCVLSDEYKNRK